MKHVYFTVIFLMAGIQGYGQANALDFDGNNDHIFAGTPFGPGNALPARSYTYEAWINMNDLVSRQTIITNGNYAGTQGTGVDIQNNRVRFFKRELGDRAEATITAGWHHVAGTYELATQKMKIYLDGVVVDSTLSSNVDANGNHYVGSNTNDAGTPFGNFFNGQMDELKVWNYARSAAEISSSFCSESTGSESGLLLYYNFNQGVAGGNNSALTQVADQTSNGNNGSLLNFSGSGSGSNFIASAAFSSTACAPPNNASVPTLSEWGLLVLGLLTLCLGAIALRKRQLLPERS